MIVVLRSDDDKAADDGAHGVCRGCGTRLPLAEPILVKFRRCYYCGQHHPLGNIWQNRTAPVIIVAALGLVAIWWSLLPS